jgi:hypothetical protein
MWLSLEPPRIVVDTQKYLACQPVQYTQVEETIEEVRELGQALDALIDVSGVSLWDVHVTGFVYIIWALHEHTRDEPLLRSIEIRGASPRLARAWTALKGLLPACVTCLVRFS